MPKKTPAASSTIHAGPSLGPRGRLAVTLLAPVLVAILVRLGPSLVEPSELPRALRSAGNFGVFALGITPFITASCLVEIAAAIVPRWAPLRNAGLEGREKLGRAALFVALLLCSFQAFSVAKVLPSISSGYAAGLASEAMVVLTLTAGAFLLCFVAQLASVYGLVGGFGLLTVTLPILYLGVAIVEQLGPGAEGMPLTPQGLAALALLSAAVVAATWFALRARPAGPPAEAPERSYRAPPEGEEAPRVEIPAPASGLSPLVATMSLLAFPVTLANLGLPLHGVSAALQNDTVFRGVALVLLIVLSAGLSWAFNQPARIAALREGGRSFADLEAEARAELRPAIARSLLFCVVLFALSQVAGELMGWGLQAAALSLATALALDVAAELRARRATPDLVSVWPEHRPYALSVARRALRAEGIPVHVRNEHLRRMLQFFGPYVPMELWVRRADAEQAAKILAAALSPKAEDERDVAKEAAARRERARRRPAALGETRVLAALSLSVAVLLLGHAWLRPPPEPRPNVSARALEILLVDDDTDPFGEAPESLPQGVSIHREDVPLGPGRTDTRRYARVVPAPGESMEQARARLSAWVEHVAVPEGDHVALCRVAEWDEDKGGLTVVGWRTFLLKGQAEITAADVADAVARGGTDSDDPERYRGTHVAVQLNAEGAARFAKLTRANIRRRLAIVVEGTVESVPVIVSEIPGGHVQIHVGVGGPEEQFTQARKLERALLGR